MLSKVFSKNVSFTKASKFSFRNSELKAHTPELSTDLNVMHANSYIRTQSYKPQDNRKIIIVKIKLVKEHVYLQML